jgi:Stage II sporulation protein E (SpoIIE)
VIGPGHQIVVVTDGIAEARGPDGRFGEERLRGELGGVVSPGQAVQRLEQALQSFTGGRLEDDVAILALTPAAEHLRGPAARPLEVTLPDGGVVGFGGGLGG